MTNNKNKYAITCINVPYLICYCTKWTIFLIWHVIVSGQVLHIKYLLLNWNFIAFQYNECLYFVWLSEIMYVFVVSDKRMVSIQKELTWRVHNPPSYMLITSIQRMHNLTKPPSVLAYTSTLCSVQNYYYYIPLWNCHTSSWDAIVPYNRLLHACLLHARLLHGCDVTHISSIGRVATSISLREHANKRYVDPDSMFTKELVLKTFDNYQ